MQSYNLPPCSEEQITIVSTLNVGNVIVDAVAGSGKTTTILHIAKSNPFSIIQILTYNKKLSFETRQKLQLLNVKNAKVNTYHSFCGKEYGGICKADKEILDYITYDRVLIKKSNYDIMILDEAQDMTALLYKLVCKFLIDSENFETRICILGDRNQCIYKYNFASEMYLTQANKLFSFMLNNNWSFCKLKTSFRLTDPMTKFINKCVLGQNRILTNKMGEKIKYKICNSFKCGFEELIGFLNEGYTFSEIFILAPSLKSEKNPCRRLANRLTEEGIPVYVPNFDEKIGDEILLENKIVFSTFHAVKGLERKVVILFGFDNSYFTYYKKNVNMNQCPNELYVAITRATERLTIIHHYENSYLPFLRIEALKKYCKFSQDLLLSPKVKIQHIQDISVSRLVDHLDVTTIHKCIDRLNIIHEEKGEKPLNIPSMIKQNNLYEDVTEITGIAIPAFYELITKLSSSLFNVYYDEYSADPFMMLDPIFQKILIKNPNFEIQDILFLSNFWNSKKNGYNFKLLQIEKYDWINNENLNIACKRLSKVISNEALYEIKYEMNFMEKTIKGYVDCIDLNNIFELKCVKSFTDQHFLQTAIYMYLNETLKRKKRKKRSKINKYIYSTKHYNYYLFNILTNEKYSLKASYFNLQKLMETIFIKKFYNYINENEDKKDFLNGNLEWVKKYLERKRTTIPQYLSIIIKIEIFQQSINEISS